MVVAGTVLVELVLLSLLAFAINVDSNECLDDKDCGKNRCKVGYERSGQYCVDVNECLKTHNCSKNAECHNIEGNYTCNCLRGFTGNGLDCIDVDECLEKTHKCGKNAKCLNTAGSYNCTCLDGYTRKGSVCEDIDECSSKSFHNCSKNAKCQNTDGSYISTTCLDGYTLIGQYCIGRRQVEYFGIIFITAIILIILVCCKIKESPLQSFYVRKSEDADSSVRMLKEQIGEGKVREEELQRRLQEAERRVEELQQVAVGRAEKVDVLDKEGFLSIRETTTTYTGKATDIKHDDLGIELHLPDQDLPPDVTECPVSVSVAVSGEFDLPGKSELVSGVYKIDSPLVVQKPVTIKMQHCVAEDGISNLSFASSTDTAPPFVYKYIDGGKFTSTHGEIEIDEFCYYTILEKHGREGLLSLYQRKYQVSLHCSKTPMIERPTCLSWSLFFTMVKNCSIFQKSVDKYFLNCKDEVERLNDIIVKFDKDSQDVMLALEGDRVELQPGWSIISLATCSIKKNEVDNYADGRPPLFRLILIQNSNQNSTDLLQKFMLKGVEVENPESFIKIFKPVLTREGNTMGPTHEAQYKRYYEKINKSKTLVLHEVIDDGHLIEIANVLQDWQMKYHLLGLTLNPDVNDIRDKYREKPELQRHEVLYLWRNRSADPTYDNLLKICAQAGWGDSARVIVKIINENQNS